jgi:rare lipoprotein A
MRLQRLCVMSVVLLAAASMAGCAGKTETIDPSPYKEGNYPGNLKIGNPYDIDGRTYIPTHDPEYVEEGMASWYGPGFHGRSTANGERFDQHAMTAAHRTLPMPSMVRVTNLENGKQALLKVNDRGPFKKDRIIDLSKAAADNLGVIDKGTAFVRVEYLPNETRDLITDLVRNNQLKATGETLAALGLQDVQAAPAAAAPAVRTGLVASANAAEAMEAGIEPRAPLAPVASRNLAAEQQQAQVGQQQEKIVVAYQEDVVPSVMPRSAEARRAYAGSRQAPPAPSGPMDLPPLPMEPAPAADVYAMAPQQPQVQPQYERPAPAARPAPASAPAPVAHSGLYVQAGSFSQEANAHKLSQQLASVGGATVTPVDIAGRTWYRVQVGPLPDMSDANHALQSLQGMGINDARIIKH